MSSPMRVQRWSSGRRTKVERQEEQAVQKRKREPENGSRVQHLHSGKCAAAPNFGFEASIRYSTSSTPTT